MKYVMMAVLFLITFTANAAIYQQNESNGGVSYSDMPSGSAKEINANEASNSITNPSATSTSTQKTESGSPTLVANTKNGAYEAFSIVSPKDQEAIQNQPFLPVQVNVKPDLRPGDEIQMVMDGVNIGSPSINTSFNLGFVERGTHQLYAVIFNSKTRAMQRQSAPITIYVHRNSAVTSPAFQK